DSGGDGDQLFFAMELVDGGLPIDRHVRERGLDRRAAMDLLARVCDAVHHAHTKGIVHRDLKPANILVTQDGAPKALDFGIARLLDTTDGDANDVTRQGEIIGTPSYMSPEQASLDPRAVDTRTDVWALGVIGYKLVTGKLPHGEAEGGALGVVLKE